MPIACELTGFDISNEGLNLAKANAKKAGVSLTALRSSIEDFNYGEAQWDLIALIDVPYVAHEGGHDQPTRLCRVIARKAGDAVRRTACTGYCVSSRTPGARIETHRCCAAVLHQPR